MQFWFDPFTSKHGLPIINNNVTAIEKIASTALSLFGTAQFLEAHLSLYANFQRKDLKTLAIVILQRQLYLLYRWSLIRYLVSHRVKRSLIKKKWFSVSPDCFIPDEADIELYIKQPKFLWRFSSNNYAYMCEIFSPSPSSSNLKYDLQTYEKDSSFIVPYLEKSNNFFVKKTLLRLFQTNSSSSSIEYHDKINKIEALNTFEYFKFNLNNYETTEIFYSDDFYLHQMDPYTTYNEFFLVLLTGECKRYKGGLLRSYQLKRKIKNAKETGEYSASHYRKSYKSSFEGTLPTSTVSVQSNNSNKSHAVIQSKETPPDLNLISNNSDLNAQAQIEARQTYLNSQLAKQNNSNGNSIRSGPETILSYRFSYKTDRPNETLSSVAGKTASRRENSLNYLSLSQSIDLISLSPLKAIENINTLVYENKASIRIKNPLFVNTDWVSDALYSINNHPYTFYRLANELFGPLCDANYFKSINKQGFSERSGWKMPCSTLGQQWIMSRYLECLPKYSWMFTHSFRIFQSDPLYQKEIKSINGTILLKRITSTMKNHKEFNNIFDSFNGLINKKTFNAIVKTAIHEYLQTVKNNEKMINIRPLNIKDLFSDELLVKDVNKSTIKRFKPKKIIIADKFIKSEQFQFPHCKHFDEKRLSAASEITFDLTPYFEKIDLSSFLCEKYTEIYLDIKEYTKVHEEVCEMLEERFEKYYDELVDSIKMYEQYRLFNYSNDKTILEQICIDVESDSIAFTPKVIPFKETVFIDSKDFRQYISEYLCYYFIKHEPQKMCYPSQYIESRNEIQMKSIDHGKFIFLVARDRYLSEIFTAFKYIQHESTCEIEFDTWEFEESTLKLAQKLLSSNSSSSCL
ncbi:hypothetical protein CANINC_004163 [Pichia inconspicua]|uniref:Uncharacterized protein n=1 Tax=Pichia inconspicua TaxID=52247 RepID=A0A4T0WWZ5_9ASCO|nr:hypothetical protein CANINC_004163 [[Candida] inconspicua]